MVKDPNILLSIINTKLRDCNNGLEEICDNLDFDIVQVKKILKTIDYEYDCSKKQFIKK